jgi:uncharacterized membrane protein YeiB
MKLISGMAMILVLSIHPLFSAVMVIEPTGSGDDTDLIQNALDGLDAGDTLQLNGDFIHKRTLYLGSDFTWILNGTLTLAGDAALDEAGYFDDVIDARRRTGITEKTRWRNED